MKTVYLRNMNAWRYKERTGDRLVENCLMIDEEFNRTNQERL